MAALVLDAGPGDQSAEAGAGLDEGWVRLRVIAVGLCFLLNMLDGADLLVMSFIAPHLATEWAISPERLGVLFSASLAGMGIGCLFVAPLADRFGRRPMILAALVLVALAMVASSVATSIWPLAITRLVVGIGVGTIGVSMSAMAGEYAPRRYANFAVGFVQAGYPLGAIITAFVAAALIDDFGWRVLFGGLAGLSVAALLLCLFALPESMKFLERRQPRGALDRLNRLRARLAQPPLDALPAVDELPGKVLVRALFDGGRARQTMLLWASTTLGFFVLYFVISWIPKLSAQAGLAVRDAIYAGASFNIGSFFGTILVGWLAIRYRLNRVTAVYMVLAAIAMLVFGGVKLPVVLTLVSAGAVGMFVNGGFNAFWAIGAALYPAEMRGTGMGWAFGIGRVGAVLGPIVGGFLVGAGLPIAAIFGIFAIPLVIIALLCLMLRIDRAGAGA